MISMRQCCGLKLQGVVLLLMRRCDVGSLDACRTYTGTIEPCSSRRRWLGNSHWTGSVRWMCNTCRQHTAHTSLPVTLSVTAALSTVMLYRPFSGLHHKGQFVTRCHTTGDLEWAMQGLNSWCHAAQPRGGSLQLNATEKLPVAAMYVI